MAARSSILLRLRALAVAALCASLLIAGARLEPRKSGYGTAQQLDVPSCSVLTNTGWPCPNCGLTTSVSATVHGELYLALRAQPFGVLMVLAAVVIGLSRLVQAVTGRDLPKVLRINKWYVIGAVAAMFLGWAIILMVGPIGGSWPIR